MAWCWGWRITMEDHTKAWAIFTTEAISRKAGKLYFGGESGMGKVTDSFHVLINLSRTIGSKVPTAVIVAVDNGGRIWNAFHVNAK